jgi:tRNA (guanine-N7-)-methyltransferase
VDANYAPGHYLVRIRKGENPELDIFNRYIAQAARLTGELYTLPELVNTFPDIFPKPRQPIIMEIGCYMGSTVVEIAERNPDINILGVDIKYKRVVKSCYKIQRAKITNAKIAIGDARELLALIPDSSLYGIISFFPDPWQKKRHKKNRFLNHRFFENAHAKLSDQGFLWLKTDSRAYYEEIGETLHQYDFHAINSLPRPLVGENHQTFFEQLFKKDNKPIYQLIIGKIKASPPADKP